MAHWSVTKSDGQSGVTVCACGVPGDGGKLVMCAMRGRGRPPARRRLRRPTAAGGKPRGSVGWSAVRNRTHTFPTKPERMQHDRADPWETSNPSPAHSTPKGNGNGNGPSKRKKGQPAKAESVDSSDGESEVDGRKRKRNRMSLACSSCKVTKLDLIVDRFDACADGSVRGA